MSHRASILLAAAAVVSCGYRSALPAFDEIAVSAVTTRAPEAPLAACVTSELREQLAASGVSVRRSSHRRLEAEILRASSEVGDLRAEGHELQSADLLVHVALRVQLVEGGRVVWGPTIYRVDVRADPGPGALEESASVDSALETACGLAAEQIVAALASAERD